MSDRVFLHDPESAEPYTADWETILAGAAISTSDWTISPTGPTISDEATATSTTSCVVEGIVEGRRYVLTNTITWAGGPATGMQRSTEIIGGQR